MKKQPELILASSSPYRAELLTRIGVAFRTLIPDAEETPLPGESPLELAQRLARAKAERIASREPTAVVIGSDQVAAVDDLVLGKPQNAERAADFLSLASGKEMVFFTAFAVLCRATGRIEQGTSTCCARFRELTQAEIARYIELDQPLDCAGAIRTEAHGPLLLDTLRGDDPSALLGLPLIRLGRALRRFGIDPLDAGTPG